MAFISCATATQAEWEKLYKQSFGESLLISTHLFITRKRYWDLKLNAMSKCGLFWAKV